MQLLYRAVPLPPPVALPLYADPREHLHFLESQLSLLMDAKDLPDWRVNPAYHPEVTAFIYSNAPNDQFYRRLRGMQKNRAQYYAKTCAHGVIRCTTLNTSRNTVLDTSACFGGVAY